MSKPAWTEKSTKILETASDLPRYNRWLISNFSPHFGKTILEIGSGTGALSAFFPKESFKTLTDIRPEFISILKLNFSDQVEFYDIEKDEVGGFKGQFDTIFSSNVFEHIERDQIALNKCFEILAPSGRLLLFVPACQEIFGSLDKDMGHYRRYTLDELKKKVEIAGFMVERIFYANLPGYFTWWARGHLISSKSNDSLFGKLFDSLITPLIYIEKFIKPPFGQSLVLVAKKK